MKKFSMVRWIPAIFSAAALLVGCGGGTGDATPSAMLLSKVDSRIQPVEAVQDVARVKSRSVTAAPSATVVALGELAAEKTQSVDSVGPRLVGQGRDVEATKSLSAMEALWKWSKTPAGGLVAAVSFNAEGAYGLRLGVLVQQLPGSAVVRVYTQAAPGKVFEISGQEILQLIERNQAAGDRSDAARTWWTPDTGGSEATLEVELPPGLAANTLQISVPQLSHVFVNLALPTEREYNAQVLSAKQIGDADTCNLDATCYNDGASERNAVARMLFIKGAKYYACTGTLLNDGSSSGKPYFLSANHCISDQTVASTLQTDWFFRSSSCNSGALQSSSIKKVGGAKLLYASADSDTSFLLLNDTPPAGAVFAGWDASTVAAGVSIIGLHHPSGDLLKLSYGTVVGQSACATISDTQFSCLGTSGNYYRVNWSQGTTEGGSSGSALFRNGKVVGTLYGGSAVCTNRSTSDYYGRFDIAYNAALKNWLASMVTDAGRVAVYRFYNASTGAHFYITGANERDYVIRNYPEFNYENVAFYAYADSNSNKDPIFRFYNATSKAHFYAGDVATRDYVIAKLPLFRYEGVSWYAQREAGNDATPIFRFYNPRTGAHFYTISAAERDLVIQVNREFTYEGPVYFAWTSQ
ncbi:MAG: peptidase S1 [Acidovorax sp. SCN 65-28]|jgi:lysyl endopeptidase|uniref:trypsin-like peptidase domain-containing protein n=1 Tax=Acidovorax sp. TaxID=1872122 RepID=UPI00086F7D13|nr:trypsin-like peptidase domain-containing protein [Acidovorax sp.]ODS79761.1 MAG: peptidase S1 [Acidovorax sp. SCN 65-28]OJU01309.1 MAG: peptidase S1 [Acidovorax sp. 65-7]